MINKLSKRIFQKNTFHSENIDETIFYLKFKSFMYLEVKQLQILVNQKSNLI
ncbi:hypothetical protein pb186bvf_002841 [Paramecium bursaria]